MGKVIMFLHRRGSSVMLESLGATDDEIGKNQKGCHAYKGRSLIMGLIRD